MPAAFDYRIYRAASPQGPFTPVGAVSGLFFEDVDQMGNATPWYYLVRASDSCGNVGP